MSDKKILFVWDNLTVYGGVRTFLMSCLEFLPSHGYQVHLIDLHNGPVVLDEDAKRFLDVITHLPRQKWDSEYSFEQRVYKEIVDQQPDLVVFVEWRHAQDVLRCLPVKVPVINFCLVDRPDALYYEYAKGHADRVTLILGNSYYITQRLRETLDPMYHDKVSELFIGVHVPGKWHQDSDPSRPLQLVYMSRLNQQQKRARDLVPFCLGLDAAGLDYHLTVVGDGDEFSYIARELSESIKAGRVDMTGTLAFPDAMSHFVGKDVFILFSAYEGMPLVLLHALAAGAVPVVTNLQSGVSELLDDGVNGLLFPVGRPETAVELVCELDKNRKRLTNLREAARKLGEKNSIRITMVEFEKRLRLIFSEELPSDLWATCSPPPVLGDDWRERLFNKLPAPVLKMLGRGE